MTNKNFKKDIVTMYTYALENDCIGNIPEKALEKINFISWESIDEMMEKQILVYDDSMNLGFSEQAAVKKFPSLAKAFEEVKKEHTKEPVGIHEFLGSVIVLINRHAVVLTKEDKEYTALPASVFANEDILNKGIEMKTFVHEDEYIIVCAKVLHELCVQENIHADLSEFIERIKKQKNPGKEIKSFYVSEDLVVKFFKELRYARALYRPEKLHGSLEKYNGKRVLTGKITNFRKAMRNAISWKYEISEDAVKGTYIDEAMDILVSKKILNMEKITDCNRYVSVPQYFVAGGAAYFMNEKGYGNFFNI